MNCPQFRLTGKIAVEETGQGVHGLTVKVLTRGPQAQVESASTLTRRDGSFDVRMQPADLDVDVHAVDIQVYDRDGAFIFGSDKPYEVKPGSVTDVQVRLEIKRLSRHLARPTTLERREGRLLPGEVLRTIDRAIGLLAPIGTAEYDRLRAITLCPMPRIDAFENFLDDIWETLDDDVNASRRLMDMLDVLSEARQESVFDWDDDDPVERASKFVEVRGGLFDAAERVLGREAVIPLVIAVGKIAMEQPERFGRYLATALDQIGAYGPIGILHRAAERAIHGGKRELVYFRGTLQSLEAWCLGEPPFPPEIPELPQPQVPHPGLVEHWGCLAESMRAIDQIRGRYGFPPREASGEYEIESITPEGACAGEVVTIRGSGFTDTPGLVRFRGRREGRDAPIDVEALTWTDTEITVQIPEDARCGPLVLRIPEDSLTVNACDVFIDLTTYRRAASSTEFMGCRPQIDRFIVNSGEGCIPRGNRAELQWSVHPPDASVIIREEMDGGTARELFNGSGRGGAILLDTSVMGTKTISITASTDCGSVTEEIAVEIGRPEPVLTILGVELTQGIQRFDLDNPSAPENNSVEMIAGMDTVVRVFVACDRDGFNGDRARITGRLLLHKSGEMPPGTEYAPINGTPPGSSPFIDAGPDPSRDRVDDSLNFLIPAAEANGSGTLTIDIVSTEVCGEYVSVRTTQPITWHARPAYPVTIRRIADPGTGQVVSATDALDTVRRAFDRLPSPRTEIRLRPGEFVIHPGTTEANYCHDGGFYQLALSVAYEHNGVEGLAPDPHESAWIGIFFQTRCSAGGMMSWPWTSTCISENNPEIAAHELAHTAGMGHTVTGFEMCDNLFQPVPCHHLPNNGQLTDVVFDIRNNRTVVGAWDLMSYRNSFRFLHPDHWERVRELMNTRFEEVVPMNESRSFIVLEGYLRETMEFTPLRGYETVTATQTTREPTCGEDVAARLLDEDEKELVGAYPLVTFPSGCTSGPVHVGMGYLQVTLARHPDARRVELRHGDQVLFTASIGKEPPIVKKVDLKWDGEQQATAFVNIEPTPKSKDDVRFFLVDHETGHRFGVGTELRKEQYWVDLRPHAGRGKVALTVEVSRDFRTGTASTESFSLPPTGVVGHIIEPADGSEWRAGTATSLIANLSDETGRAVPWDEKAVTWVIDGTETMDSRQIALWKPVDPGKHSIELVYRNPNGEPVVLDRIEVIVLEKTPAQLEYERFFKEYLA